MMLSNDVEWWERLAVKNRINKYGLRMMLIYAIHTTNVMELCMILKVSDLVQLLQNLKQ